MSNHTKGPWKATRDDLQGYYAIRGEDGTLVFETGGNTLHTKNRDANALLIAASPDLLEAAEAALKLWDKHGLGDDDDESAPVYSQLRAAIAKAKGE